MTIKSTQVEITAEQVFDGFYYWLKSNAWVSELDPNKADETQEAAGLEALLLLCAQDIATFRHLPIGVQNLAWQMLLIFMAQLRGPLKGRSWLIEWSAPLDPEGLARAFWIPIEIEILQQSPPPAALH